MKCSDRLIEPPPRSSLSGTALIIINAVLFSVVFLLPSVRPRAALFAALLLVAALLLKQTQALHLSVLSVLVVGVPLLHPGLSRWPFMLLVPIILYFALTLLVLRLRTSLLWLRPGRFSRDTLLLVLATAVISGIGLYLWRRLMRPDLSIHLAAMPAAPLWIFPFAGLAFSLGNAAVEEIAFRGVVMQATDSALAPGLASVIVQGWLFGAMHYLRGFPNGLWGVAMATVYGIMLGGIRRRSDGMLAPWLAHVLADIVIFTILAVIVLQ